MIRPMSSPNPVVAAPAGGRYRSKTIATWVALAFGALGGLRFYLRGPRDTAAWLHLPPTLLGLWGAWRMDSVGQDDRLASLLVTVLPFGVDPPDASFEDDEFINVVAQNLPMPEDDRQELLERSSVLARAQALVDRLQK